MTHAVLSVVTASEGRPGPDRDQELEAASSGRVVRVASRLGSEH